MADKTPHSYLRTHRRQSGLTQRELATILGQITEGQVSRHELGANIPPLAVALGYEIIFRVPASQIFPGIQKGAGGHPIKPLELCPVQRSFLLVANRYGY
jgi:transcriptional regulator with XRE-family HTH domain